MTFFFCQMLVNVVNIRDTFYVNPVTVDDYFTYLPLSFLAC